MKNWNVANIASQKGKTFLITGANSGTGFGTARTLAQKGGKVIMAVRNLEKGDAAKAKIMKETPHALIELMPLDLADLTSVAQFSKAFLSRHEQLDVLINNAGIALPYDRQETRQGFEAHFGTNHLGHFALTAKLLALLQNTKNSRIVTVASFVPKNSKSIMNWDDLQNQTNFDGMRAYGESKLANIMFALELQERLVNSKRTILSLIANPGFTKSGIQDGMSLVVKLLTGFFAQSVEMGMLPILRAAIDPAVKGGEFYGPLKMKEMRGYPELTHVPDPALIVKDRQKLWTLSEQMTQTSYNFD